MSGGGALTQLITNVGAETQYEIGDIGGGNLCSPNLPQQCFTIQDNKCVMINPCPQECLATSNCFASQEQCQSYLKNDLK